MTRVCVLMVLCGCFAATPVMTFGSGVSEEESRRSELVRMAPGQLDASARWTGPIRTGKVRVWADDDYRAQNVGWEHAFARELDALDRVTGPMLGLHLEPEFHSWDRHVPEGRLDEALAALQQVDTGNDVVAVIGLTSALALVSGTYDELGIATLGEPYLVVRGYAYIEERSQLERQLTSYDEVTREQMITARRAHKTTTVLLHELAHSLGAIHERLPDDVMNPLYSHEATRLGARNLELAMISLADRIKPMAERDRRATYAKLATALDRPWESAVAEDRATMLDQLRAVGVSVTIAAATTTPSRGNALANTTSTVRLHEAQRLLDAGNIKAARDAIATDRHGTPDRATALVACEIDLADANPTSTMCDRAAEPEAGDRDATHIVDAADPVVHAMVAAHAPASVVRLLANVEMRLAGDHTPAAWLALAQQYRDIDAVDEAEHAITVGALRPGSDDRVSNWVALTRARYGVPHGTHDDFAAVTAVRNAITQISTGRLDDASTAIQTAEAKWPRLPGLVGARCDLEWHRHHVDAARTLCRQASSSSSWALYVHGRLEVEAGTPAAAIPPLEHAIAMDPELMPAWPTLATALARTGNKTKLAGLRRDYKAQFHRALPE